MRILVRKISLWKRFIKRGEINRKKKENLITVCGNRRRDFFKEIVTVETGHSECMYKVSLKTVRNLESAISIKNMSQVDESVRSYFNGKRSTVRTFVTNLSV